MNGQRHDVLVVGHAEYGHPDQGGPAQHVERAVGILAGEPGGIRGRAAAQVVFGPRRLGLAGGQHVLHRLAVAQLEPGAQRLMPADQVAKRGAQDAGVEPAADAGDQRDVVGGGLRSELGEDQELFLRIGQRPGRDRSGHGIDQRRDQAADPEHFGPYLRDRTLDLASRRFRGDLRLGGDRGYRAGRRCCGRLSF
jgi:hypothetical protein